MEISTGQARKLRPTLGKIVMAVAFTSAIGALGMTPAFAKDNDRHDNRHDRNWRGDHDRYDHRPDYRPVYRPVYQHPYYYSQPVYVPPPVYYPPPPSPGISLFLPFDIRIR